MGERVPRTREDCFTLTIDFTNNIANPHVETNNFELKPYLISMVQTSTLFRGLPTEDPNVHLKRFIRMENTVKYNSVSTCAIRLRIFPWSLSDKASIWLSSQVVGSITTWDQLTKSFLKTYFPPSMFAKFWTDITNFVQFEQESLYEILHNGLSIQSRSSIDAACGGSIIKKEHEVYALVEEIATNSCQWSLNDKHVKKQVGMYKVETNTILEMNVDKITKQLETLILDDESNLGNPWAKQIEDANYVSQKDGDAKKNIQDALVKYMQKVGHPCMGVLANYIGNTNERLKSIESKTQVQPILATHIKEINYGPNTNRQNSNFFKPPHVQRQEERKPDLQGVLATFIEKTDIRLQNMENQVPSNEFSSNKIEEEHGLANDPSLQVGGEEEEMLMFLKNHYSQRSWSNHKFEELERDDIPRYKPSIE
uniref:Uncharacterized protein LOC101489118 n=1 Tax=Cicer arietinum TaxID=3827 RepID=A0A1S2YLC6_CICAR|nr:uncharacterized protein LOC101489118 [Cicer arietinum]